MKRELIAYLRAEAVVCGAFNFFVNGMLAGLIHHRAERVSVAPASAAIDLFLTCFTIFLLAAPFAKASLGRTKAAALLPCSRPFERRLSRAFRRPALFGALCGALAAAAFIALVVPALALAGFETVAFLAYVMLKSAFSALLGAAAMALCLYAGMLKENG